MQLYKNSHEMNAMAHLNKPVGNDSYPVEVHAWLYCESVSFCTVLLFTLIFLELLHFHFFS